MIVRWYSALIMSNMRGLDKNIADAKSRPCRNNIIVNNIWNTKDGKLNGSLITVPVVKKWTYKKF